MTQNISFSVNFDSYESDAVQVKVDIDGDPLLFGVWDVRLRRQGRLLLPQGSWTETCSQRDKGCDYLEIDVPLSGEYRLQRCFLLDHDDEILILGDALLKDFDAPVRGKPPELEYESTLMLDPSLVCETSDDATELTFHRPMNRKKHNEKLRVLPLSLSEWQSQCADGSLEFEQSILTYRRRLLGDSLFSVLFFDLNPNRLRKPYTWRRLSVGENMQRVHEDKAAGFRIQLGREQYLLYRSLTLPANRTVLGHNLIDDFCFARFDPETGVEGLIEVQQVFD